jgi:hypothetical protein
VQNILEFSVTLNMVYKEGVKEGVNA